MTSIKNNHITIHASVTFKNKIYLQNRQNLQNKLILIFFFINNELLLISGLHLNGILLKYPVFNITQYLISSPYMTILPYMVLNIDQVILNSIQVFVSLSTLKSPIQIAIYLSPAYQSHMLVSNKIYQNLYIAIYLLHYQSQIFYQNRHIPLH